MRTPNFRYFVGSSWLPKVPRTIKNAQVPGVPKLAINLTEKIQLPGKVDAGEDALFESLTATRAVLGVADGVGGWAESGVDPAVFSWTLMNNCSEIAELKQNASLHPGDILSQAYKKLLEEGKVDAGNHSILSRIPSNGISNKALNISGSSTACLLGLSKATGNMESANLGDSSYLIIRDEQVLYRSKEQQHYFNCPYQLTVLPKDHPNRDNYCLDEPSQAFRGSHQLEDNDIVILGTDGYFDNVFDRDTISIMKLIKNELKGFNENSEDQGTLNGVQKMAETLTFVAKRLAMDRRRISPWARGARAAGAHNEIGGKLDDITVMVTLVRGN
ncbi:Protein phosphatase 2C 7 [Basidiobolus ranarum]|uniref:Protein phosphatase n=1 Tax=Basidiobolus ranarum TaxID=34480 RepID=A0ABR2X496_9FUNG